MTPMTSGALVETRTSWHRVAEHVLAAGQFADAGTIRLRPFPGGFATAVGIGGHLVAVVDDVLLVVEGARFRMQPLSTLRAAAEFTGITPGLRGSYRPSTSEHLDAPLRIDVPSARLLADWFALGDAALRRFAGQVRQPAEPVLWPEHFDLAITLDEVNYGVSPGDDAVAEPYVYVGPYEGPPSGHPFWNAPFGATAGADRVTSAADAVAFCSEGRDRVLTDRSRTR